MNILSDPLSLFLILILSAVSSFFFYLGVKEKNVPMLLIGIGSSIPTFGVTDYRYWLAGLAIVSFAVWLRRIIESI